MWDQLPELILTKIFNHLARQDRVTVSRVCRNWAQTLAAPCLWRNCIIYIDRDFALDLKLSYGLTIKYGEHMRRLKLAWSRPCSLPREPRVARSVQAEAGADFLKIVCVKGVQLTELILIDWAFSSKWGNCGKLLHALANLLTNQRNLQKLSLWNASFSLSDVVQLLAIVTKSCGTHLRLLDLQGAFREWQTPFQNKRYLRLLGRLRALVHLSLDYPALSDGVLRALAAGSPKVLRTLHVCVRDSDSRQHRIENAIWGSLVAACPDLTVSYTIINLSHHEDIFYLLQPSIPLVKFQMFGSLLWDQSRSRNFRGTVGLLIDHYTDTLVEVLLHLKNNRETLDDLILLMMKNCKHLKELQYDGILQNLGTIRDICQLQMDKKISFRAIHLKPKNLTLNNRALLHDVSHEFDRKMMEEGIDFRIENPV